MDTNSKIYVAGHNGMVGNAICRRLKSQGYRNILTQNHANLDLVRQNDVEKYFSEYKPDYVIDAAAKVGGILANTTYRGQFIYENMMIQNNLIHASHVVGVKKFLFLGSSCIYPKIAPQPLKEEYLLSSDLEKSNEPYAVAKIAGIKMCESYYQQYGDNFISVMPTNLYGFNDNFNLHNSHVLPALIRKIHVAKIENAPFVEIWGSGKPRREFLYVDDMASACVFILKTINAFDLFDKSGISHINIGTGVDVTIEELALVVKKIIGFNGEFVFDTSKPDGTLRKLLDVSRLHQSGWKHKINLEEGIRKTYKWFLNSEYIRK